MPNKKQKRRLMWAIFIFLLLCGGGTLIAVMAPNYDPTPKVDNPANFPDKIEAELAMQEVFCYCSVEDLAKIEAIAAEQTKSVSFGDVTVGGMECGSGYYDQVNNIAYVSVIYSQNMFLNDEYLYRDFELNRGINRFDIFSLATPEYYNKPIIFRIHSPKIFTNASKTSNYGNLSGQEGYSFIRYTDVRLGIKWKDRELSSSYDLMVLRPARLENYGKIPFEEYAKLLDIDLSQFIFIDIR